MLAANSDVASVTADLSRDTATAPNDPRYSDQWSLPQIGWDNAFGTIDPGSSATVAVLDTGVDASQPDLQGVVVPGTDIVDGSGDGTTDPNGHGTEMAGIVAAATDNNVGIAGVGYSGVNVMPVTVLGADGTGLDSDVINGVVWATQHGADVILMSFSNPGYSSALQSAINWAWSQGVVIVAAAGNDGTSTLNFPAGDKGVMGVGSTGIGDAPSMFSNTGADVFIAAPGEDILTTDAGGGYSSVTGTSASAAAVAGAAALLKANSPMATNGVIVNRLAESADAAGTSDQTGNGRLNLDRAINDTSETSIEPAGAPPTGDGGPFVGPYVAAALGFQTPTYNSGTTTLSVTATGTNHNKVYQFSYTPPAGGGATTFTPCEPGGSGATTTDSLNLSAAYPSGFLGGTWTIRVDEYNASTTCVNDGSGQSKRNDSTTTSVNVPQQPAFTTAIHNASHAVVTSVGAGSTVHDSAIASGSAGTPTGSAAFSFWNNGTCNGTASATSSALCATSGSVDATTFTQGPLSAGSYSFRAHYTSSSSNHLLDRFVL